MAEKIGAKESSIDPNPVGHSPSGDAKNSAPGLEAIICILPGRC